MDPRKRARILDKIQSGRATRSERLYLKQEGLCFYCWEDLEKDITKEHLHSRALGGTNERVNLRVAHMRCNGIVGSLSVDLKLELHEIGRDKGATAFWQKAREYQDRYGSEKKAYGKFKSFQRPQRITNANTHPTREDPHEISREDAEIELEKMALGTPGNRRRLSKAEKMILWQAELTKRERTGLPVNLDWKSFFRALDRRQGVQRSRAA